jgi:DNA-binding transcriptional LysR family regulator
MTSMGTILGANDVDDDSRKARTAVHSCTPPGRRGSKLGACRPPTISTGTTCVIFLRAAQAGSFARAARSMRVEHTTVGRRLSALERALGASLVTRGPEGLALTPLGALVQPLVADVERAVGAVREMVTQQRSRVRLAVPSGFSSIFSAALPELRKRHPELSIELSSGARPVDLGKGEADIAIRSGPIGQPDLVVKKLCMSGFSLYASESYVARRGAPIDPDDLRAHDVIGYDVRLSSTPPARWIEERVPKERIVLRSREMTDVLAAVASGVGIAVLPCMLGDESARPRQGHPGDRGQPSPVAGVPPRGPRWRPRWRAVIAFVVEVIEENAGRITGRAPRRR